MKIEEIEKRYAYKFPKLFKELWNNGMIDWMDGHQGSINDGKLWANEIYPKIKDNPPLLLHTGGFDFEMLQNEEMLNWKFDELWDVENHQFIPFAKTDEGNVYAFYKGIKTDGENAIVYIWNDMNETEVLAKNFEDFIFRKMLEAVYDVDKDELDADYKETGFNGYREDILRDLNSIRPYLNEKYLVILEDIYKDNQIIESSFSYGLCSNKKLVQIIKEYLDFEELDNVFEHELD